MALPWVRLDSNIASHDKILSLLDDPSSLKWQAAASYMFALGWSGAHETDGKIPTSALRFVHASQKTARLLVHYRLWEEGTACFWIVNYGLRQQSSAVTQATKQAQSEGAKLANCKRHHGQTCWRDGKCSRSAAS